MGTRTAYIMSVAAGCALALPVHAAQVFFDAPQTVFSRGAHIVLPLTIDTEEENINAIEGTVRVPAGISFEEHRDGGSIISLWVTPPSAAPDGIIRFSGIIPGGYRGDAGHLASLVFRAETVGQKRITIPNVRAFVHTARATPAAVTARDIRITITNADAPNPAPLIDTTPPEPFTPMVVRDPALFGGRYALVFAAHDKRSGIDYYEVSEARVDESLVWTEAASPYVLADQTRQSEIRVRAVDNAGNETTVAVPPAQDASDDNSILLGIIIGVLVIAAVGYAIIHRR